MRISNFYQLQKNFVYSNLLELLGDGSDLLDAILVSCEIALESLVLLLQSLQLVQLALSEVLAGEHLLFAAGPVLVGVGLVLELLSKMLETLKPHHLGEQPVLEGLLGGLQALPRLVDVGYHLALGRHVRRTIAQPQLGLQRVEVRFELGFLLDTWGLVLAPVGAVLFQLLLATGE